MTHQKQTISAVAWHGKASHSQEKSPLLQLCSYSVSLYSADVLDAHQFVPTLTLPDSQFDNFLVRWACVRLAC